MTYYPNTKNPIVAHATRSEKINLSQFYFKMR